MTTVLGPCLQESCVLPVGGPLRVPITRDLRHHVGALLRRGERGIVLDLARVSSIDAAGIGELVRAYNMTAATDGLLRVVHARPWVRELLVRAGLFDLLSADAESPRRASSNVARQKLCS